jgi:hypothetical protein
MTANNETIDPNSLTHALRVANTVVPLHRRDFLIHALLL